LTEDWSPRQRLVIVAAAGVAGCVLWLSGSRGVEDLVPILLAAAAAAALAWLSPAKPVAAFGILFLVASISGFTVSSRLGNMRLEQPAIVAGYAALLLAPSKLDLRRLRPLWPIGAAFGVYLACLGLSSLLFAPDRMDSLRMTFWTGLSMSGGLLALLLLMRGSGRATDWILASGYVQAAVGIVCAVLFFTLGPVLLAGQQPAPGVTMPVSLSPKVFGLSWEANIYASLLAAVSIFGIDRFLSGSRSVGTLLVPIMVGAIALGVTRGAYVGLAAGLAVYLLLAATPVRLWSRQTVRRVGVRGAVIVGSLAAGLLVSAILMQGGRPPTKPLDLTQPGWGRAAAAGAPGAGAQSSATPTLNLAPVADTVTFRLDRIPVALADVPMSPWIGLGANSFGQRHTDISQGAPDHIAILALAALYEAGILGAAGLGIGFALALLTLLKASRLRPNRGMIAAYAGALVCLLVAYETTNAINFALIWLTAGAGLSATLRPLHSNDPVEGLAAALPG
jgi:hypothetical protein